MRSRFSRTAFAGFDLVFQPWLRRHIHRIEVRGTGELPDGLPIVLAANHTSWWDGFLLRELQRRIRPDAPLYTVMLKRELERHRIFAFLGALPLEPGSPTSLRALLRHLAAERARNPRMVVAFFPQGRLWPSTRRPLGFRRGLGAVARAVSPAVVLPVGLHLEPHNHPTPTAYVVVGKPVDASAAVDPVDVERRVQEVLDVLLQELGAVDAPERVP